MDLGLEGRVALVAGASCGLGFAAAERFAREGASVVLVARSPGPLESAAQRIADATGASVEPVSADVTSEEEVHRLVGAALHRFGRIDCLVTNAGGPPPGGFARFAEGLAPYRAALELNLLSTVLLCQAVVPALRRNGFGRIVAVTSIAAREPTPTLLLSSMARSGVLGFVKSLARELAAEGITVNAVCPGYTRTERLTELADAESSLEGITPEEVYAEWTAAIPMGRLADPAEFAAVVAFLASEPASYVTGTAVAIDGGLGRGLL